MGRRSPDRYAHVVSFVILDALRVVGGQDFSVGLLDAARVTAVLFKAGGEAHGCAPGPACVVAQLGEDAELTAHAVAIAQEQLAVF